jgi:glyoxylase-like metal-dependent hydrolase (beta-lactamase superfamily II)
VLTHRHFDHIGALPQILRHADVPLIAHTLEAEAINEHFRKPLAALRSLFAPVLVSKTVDEGDFISVGDARLSVLHTPGHTIGSMCLYDAEEGVLIAGDTLFFEAVGRTDLPTGDVRQQRGSLKKLSALPEDTRVYPGHDQATTIAHEKEQGFLRDWV